jgi:hypothetical protein
MGGVSNYTIEFERPGAAATALRRR